MCPAQPLIAARHRSTVLLERERDLAALRGALEAAQGGSGRMVVVSGTAGIGKSAMLEAVAAAAQARRLTVLRGRGAQLEQALPFGVVMQLFERRLAALDPADRAVAFGGAAGPARMLFEDTAPA